MRRLFMGVPLLLLAAYGAVAAPQPAASANPKKALSDARLAAEAGRLTDAAAHYDAVIASTARDAPRYKSDALYGLALIRLSADKAVGDPARARAALQELAKSDPKYPRRQESAVFLALLDSAQDVTRRLDEQTKSTESAVADAVKSEAAKYKTRLDEQAARLDALTTQGTGVKAETDKLRQDLTTLRAENRSIRDELASTKAELAKKDAALKKIAGSIVKTPR